MNFLKFTLILIKKEIIGSDIKAYLNQKEFKINENNKPRIFSNTISLKKRKAPLRKVFLHYVIIEKKISVLHGPFKLQKCCMIIKKKLFIMTMLF